MMKRYLTILMAALLLAVSCNKNRHTPDNGQSTAPQTTETDYTYVNAFGKGVMTTYYLWEKEIAKALTNWTKDVEPIAYVKEIRYKQNGKDFDRWTQMLDDYEGFVSSVQGISETYGYDVILALDGNQESQYIVAIVTFVYKDSPADKAGLKRGDAIRYVNGKGMVQRNYVSIINNELFNSKSVTIKLNDEAGTEISLEAVDMYEDPVVLYKTLQAGDKKVGYMVFTSFTRQACDRLVEACRFFREEGIKDLILDLRYNGGGYVFTQEVLSSMLAPAANVEAGDILETTVYNELLAKHFGNGATKLTYTHEYTENNEKITYDTSDANIGIEHLYAIISSGSASASESLITDLLPYMPVTLIGEQSHGKFCTGLPIGLTEWYEDANVSRTTLTRIKKLYGNWGIYVMIGRYADKNGITPCMPDGFTPDIKVEDKPWEKFQLGDPEEAMLKVALNTISPAPEAPAPAARKAAGPSYRKMDYIREKADFGKYILTKEELDRRWN